MEEKDFLEKLQMEKIIDIELAEEKIEIFRNESVLFYRIESDKPIEQKFNAKEILFSKDFLVDGKYKKFVILKIKQGEQ